MSAAAKTGVDGGGVADALIMCEFKALVSGFADDGVQDLENKSGFDVLEAGGSGCHLIWVKN
jgi:hypothetical protein